MNYILCRNRVRNFDYWKGVFDSHANDHRAAGLKLVHLWYELTSPHNVFFLFEAEDIERARAFLNSSEGSATPHDSGLIEGEARFFSESLSYGLLNDAESRAFAAAVESGPATDDANKSRRVEPVSSSLSPQSVKSAEPGRNAEPEKRRTPSESATSTEPTSTQPKTTEPAKSSTPAATMKDPERAKNAPPLELVDGWQPVGNWPPAEAAAEAEATHEASESRRDRWMRRKY